MATQRITIFKHESRMKLIYIGEQPHYVVIQYIYMYARTESSLHAFWNMLFPELKGVLFIDVSTHLGSMHTCSSMFQGQSLSP